MKRALEGLDGIKKADVSFNDKKAVVTYDPARVAVKNMVNVIAQLGFQAREIAMPQAAKGQQGDGK